MNELAKLALETQGILTDEIVEKIAEKYRGRLVKVNKAKIYITTIKLEPMEIETSKFNSSYSDS